MEETAGGIEDGTEDGAEGDTEGGASADLVELKCTASLTVHTESWKKLVENALPVVTTSGLLPSSYTAEVAIGTVICFLAKNDYADALFAHQVFVVRGEESVHIFHKDGRPFAPTSSTGPGDSNNYPLTGDAGFLTAWEHELFCVAVYKGKATSRFRLGSRIALAFQENDEAAAAWYAGFIAEEKPRDESKLLIAFDDGDLRYYEEAFLKEKHEEGLFKEVPLSEGGIVHNDTGLPMAKRVVWLKEGRAKEAKPIGVLIGETGDTLGGAPVYQSFVFSSGVSKAAGRTRASHARPASPVRGFQSFRRHDVLDYLKGTDEDNFQSQASVVGLTYQEAKDGGVDGCKYLQLAEVGSQAFFVGKWHEWKRSTKKADADPNDDDNVVQLTDMERLAVEAAYEKTEVFCVMDNMAKVKAAADKLSSKGPPLLLEARAAERKADREREQRAKKAGREREQRSKSRAPAAAHPRGGKRSRNQNDVDEIDAFFVDEHNRPTSKTKEQQQIHRLKRELDQLKAQQKQDQLKAQERPPIPQVLAQPLTEALPIAQAMAPMPASADRLRSPSVPVQPHQTAGLPQGWKSAVSSTGVIYYYNKSTNESQYEHPSAASPPLPPPPSAPTALPPVQRQTNVPDSPVPIPMSMSMAQSQTMQFAQPQAQVQQPLSMPKAPAFTSVQPATPSMGETLVVRAARLRAQLSRETNPSVQSYLAGELASVEEWQRMGYG